MTLVLRSVAAFLALEGVALIAPSVLSSPTAGPTVEACLGHSDHSMAPACHRMAVDLAAARDYERAIAVEERVFEMQPSNPEVAAFLAKLYQAGRSDAAHAIKLYHEALFAAPGYPPALYGLGLIMKEKGEMAIAERYFKRGARENPDQPLFKVRLAEVLVAAGRADEARPILDEIVAKWPGSEEAGSARRLMTRTALARP